MKSLHPSTGLGKPGRLLLMVTPFALLVAVVFTVVLSARRALERATEEAASGHQIAFTLRPWMHRPTWRGQPDLRPSPPGTATTAGSSSLATYTSAARPASLSSAPMARRV